MRQSAREFNSLSPALAVPAFLCGFCLQTLAAGLCVPGCVQRFRVRPLMAGIDFSLHCSLTPLNCLFEELQKWQCPDYYENNVHKMQLPFSSKLLGSTLTAEEKQERRQQQLRRLQELNARRREEKLQLDQERLERLLYVQAGDVCGAGPWPCSARCSLPVWFP
jgi:hypothetical protein